MFSDKIKGLKEWYGRFRGRKFYSKVRKIYTRSNEIGISKEKQKEIVDVFGRNDG